MVVGHGGHWTKDGQPGFMEPEVIAGVQYFKDLFRFGRDAPRRRRGPVLQWPYFNSGKAAMTNDGPWYWASLGTASPEVQSTVTIHPLPTDSAQPDGWAK